MHFEDREESIRASSEYLTPGREKSSSAGSPEKIGAVRTAPLGSTKELWQRSALQPA
jgi:hypothetical protein